MSKYSESRSQQFVPNAHAYMTLPECRGDLLLTILSTSQQISRNKNVIQASYSLRQMILNRDSVKGSIEMVNMCLPGLDHPLHIMYTISSCGDVRGAIQLENSINDPFTFMVSFK